MKSLQEFINEASLNEAKRDVSTFDKSIGKALSKHAEELSKLKTINDIYKFIDLIKPEVADEGKKYIEDTLLPNLKAKKSFLKAHEYLYNIYLAGFEDSKIGR